MKKYSFYQIDIFIKLFISQFGKFENKLNFSSGNKEETEDIIQKFIESTKFFTDGIFARIPIEKNTNIDSLSEIYEKDLYDNAKYRLNIPLIFINKEENLYRELNLSNRYSNSKDYLQKLKEVLYLPNDVEKDEGDKKSLISILNNKFDNFIITEDNFKKMILIFYRIKANIPVIIMGERGCGKTSLILKLNQLLNNGEISLRIININPDINDNDIYNSMKRINNEAKNIKEEMWVLFDEINTCLSLPLLTEIFINRTCNGEKLNDNIRLIGTCIPYVKIKINEVKYGLSRDDDNKNELVYLAQPLPQSLFFYVFSFGSINEEDEKRYIFSILGKLFTEKEKKLHEITSDAIFKCHKYLREIFYPSVVSLREISKFCKVVEFFKMYFSIKDKYLNIDKNGKEILYKIKSIICSIYICYYIRLIDDRKRFNFDLNLRKILLKLINSFEEPGSEGEENEECNLYEQIKYKELKNDLKNKEIKQFSDLLKFEEEFFLDLIVLDKGIFKNKILKENTFLIFLSVITKIPLILIGKPGTGKSLSAQLIYNSLKGKYSNNEFFRNFPPIIQTYFGGSELTNPEDVEKLFQIAENKYKLFCINQDFPISMILFDELGLAEKSESDPLKVLYSKFDYTGCDEKVSFIGISNYLLDTSKFSTALILYIPSFEDKFDDLIETSESIVESISEDLNMKQKQVFNILARAYFQYKNILNTIKELTVLNLINKKSKGNLLKRNFEEIKLMKEYKVLFKNEKNINIDFHGNSDFYHLIKEISIEMEGLSSIENNKVKSIIERYIEKNFGGIDYEIDIDFKLELNDIKDKIEFVRKILEEFIPTIKKYEKIRVSSVFLFKKAFNIECGTEYQYQIRNKNCKKYDLNKCIIDNINGINNSRYLLIGTKSCLSSIIYNIIKIQYPDKTIELYEGSPYAEDNNKEYIFKKINDIKDDAKTEKIIILNNLNQIQSFLFDLYKMNYIIKGEQKYTRISIDNFYNELTPINDLFRIIILVDKKFINYANIVYLSKLEKIKFTFDKLLYDEQRELAKRIIEEINLKYYIENFQKFSAKYNLIDLLVNCGKEDIECLGYILYIEMNKNNNNYINEEKIKEKVFKKISNILPQDIVSIIPKNHVITKLYDDKHYYNLKDYITDKNNEKYKISIIYTFTNLLDKIDGFDSDNVIEYISKISNENQLKANIEELKIKNENNRLKKDYKILFQFEQLISNKIQYISNFIIKNFKEDKYNYIFIIYVKRNFVSEKREIIYSIPNINPDINQLFIDNLNGKQIALIDILDKKLKEFVDDLNESDLNRQFESALARFVNKELNEKNKDKNCSNNKNDLNNEVDNVKEITKYFEEEKDFKQKLIKKAKKLYELDKEVQGNCKSLMNKILKI